jgi:hypothetical protein
MLVAGLVNSISRLGSPTVWGGGGCVNSPEWWGRTFQVSFPIQDLTRGKRP